MYSLKMIQESNYKLKEPNPLDAAVSNALGTPPVIRRRNEKLGKGAAEEPKKKTSPIDGAVGDPALVRQRRNVELGLGKIVDGERNKKTRRGKGRGRSKSNNVSAEDHNAHVKAKEEYDDTRARAKKINDKLVADAHADELWKKRDAWKAATAWKTDKGNTALIAAKRRVANERLEKTRGRIETIKTNRNDARAKLKANNDMNSRAHTDDGLATNIFTRKVNKRSADNKALKVDAHASARKKHLENKAKTSKQRKNRGAIGATGLAATGGLIHQNSDAIKSAYDDI